MIEGRSIIVVKGLPEQFYDMHEAEEYAEEQTLIDKEPHTLIVVDSELFDNALTTEYVGVRLITRKNYEERHRKDL
jgi:hypothetical protein